MKKNGASKAVPKVVIDARMVFPQAHGIGRYVKNLATGLAEIAEKDGLEYEPIFLVDKRHPSLLPSQFEAVAAQAQFLNPKELVEIPSLLKRLGADLYHSPSFSSLAYAPCPWIATVHDLNHLQFGNLKQKIYYRVLLKNFARNASALLTVSEFAKQELREWLPFPRSRQNRGIEVVYNALEPGFENLVQISTESARAEFQALSNRKGWKVRSGEYLICLSNSKPHKNLPFLIESYFKATEAAKASGQAILPLLLSVSPDEITNQQEGIICTSHLDDTEAKLVLAHARAAVFPSLYEGFGLPPLEAIISGTPILVSDIAPHREGLRDFNSAWVKWLRPSDSQEWIQALSELPVTKPTEMRADSRYITAREAALKRYSVKRLAEHMDRIYTGVLGVKS